MRPVTLGLRLLVAYLHECSGPFLKEHCREVFGVTPLQSTVTPNTSLAAHEKTVTKGLGYSDTIKIMNTLQNSAHASVQLTEIYLQ